MALFKNRRPDVGSEVERRQIELAGSLHRRERDREVLDREPGRVECRDLVIGTAPVRFPGENGAELSDLLALQRACLDGVHELAVVARLLRIATFPNISFTIRPRA